MNNSFVLAQLKGSELFELLETHQKTLNSTFDHRAISQILDAVKEALLAGESPEQLALRIAKKRSKPKPIVIEQLTDEEAKKWLEEDARIQQLKHKSKTFKGNRKLDPYRQLIRKLAEHGASQHIICRMLKKEHGVKVSQPTVQRFLSEMKNG